MTNISTAAIVVSALAIFLAIEWFRLRRRTGAIKGLAIRHGFHFLGEALPRLLFLAGTPMERASSTRNAIDGEREGIRIIAFDCKMGTGKHSWRRTVVAAQAVDDVFSANIDSDSLTTDRSNGWILLYEPRRRSFIPGGLMSIAELEAHLTGVAK